MLKCNSEIHTQISSWPQAELDSLELQSDTKRCTQILSYLDCGQDLLVLAEMHGLRFFHWM